MGMGQGTGSGWGSTDSVDNPTNSKRCDRIDCYIEPARSNALLADDLIIVCMAPNPEPLDPTRYVVTQCAVVLPYSHGPHFSDSLEMQRWMFWIGLEKLDILVRDLTHGLGQRIVERPEACRCSVIQRGRGFRALWSAIDSSMRRSSFPAAASASI